MHFFLRFATPDAIAIQLAQAQRISWLVGGEHYPYSATVRKLTRLTDA